MNHLKRKTYFSGCGIAGGLFFNPETQKKVKFENIINSLKHRGPDGYGILEIDNIILGHRRLSILDLSERGSQPMTRDHFTIISNGEIYNFKEIRETLLDYGYKFQSDTDTEVILRAYQLWGVDSLSKFNGMFAFAIWDNRNKNLFMARDRLGIKPLYFYKDTDAFLFASEVQALMKSKIVPFEHNWDAFSRQLIGTSFLQANQKETLINNVYSLEAGHYLNISFDGNFKINKYWDLPDHKDKLNVSDKELTEQFKDLFINSINYRLISDVPVSAFLSGGLDSSLINVFACKAMEANALTSLTVSYVGGGVDVFSNVEDSDLKYSKIFIDSLTYPCKHKEIIIGPEEIKNDSIDKLIDLSYLIDDDRLLTLYKNYRSVNEMGLKVVLNGQGADEIMGGYVGFKHVYNGLVDVQNPTKNVIRNILLYRSIPDEKTLSKELLDKRLNIQKEILEMYNKIKSEPIEKAHRFLLKTQLLRILRFEDFLSMKSGVECRVPFLDHNIVEWAFKVPFHKHVNTKNRTGKNFLKRIAVNSIPQVLIDRPKQTFPKLNIENNKRTLLSIFQTWKNEILTSNLIQRAYNTEVLLKNPGNLNYEELWLIIAIWRQEEVIKNIKNG
jgi:asparagine synthase (glutamine-hydrolysing)